MALRLGRTVDELLDTLSSTELTEWMAFDRIQPIGDERQDVNQAIQTSIIYNMQVKKQHQRKLKDFLPGWFMPSKPSEEHQKEIDKEILEGFLNAGRKVIHKKRDGN